jgi:hypothetical protein
MPKWPFAKAGTMVPFDPKSIEKLVGALRPPPVCSTCGCYIEETRAQKVECARLLQTVYLYYCVEHRKPYGRMQTWDGKFFATIEVDEDGTPIGYKKVKNA